MSNRHDSKVSKVYQVGDEPTYSKVDKVYVVNQSGSGGGVADEVAWENVTDKPAKYPPEAHDHDDRYNTKEDVQEALDLVTSQIEGEMGRVQMNEADTLGYLSNKIDNTTVVVEGNELKVKGVDGLTVGATDISTWLAGTTNNVQTQIDGINDNLVAMTSGMHYRGRLETYAELQSIGNLNNGDLAVVLADESREGLRSMYVYNESNGNWEFIGAFTFSDKFTALSDTPASLDGQDGKILKARSGRVVVEDLSYNDLTDKPNVTTTQITEAVENMHEHSNKSLLDTYTQTNANITTAVVRAHTHDNKTEIDRLGVNEQGQLTIDGVAYVPASETTSKQYLHLRNGANQVISATGTKIRFNTKNYGDIPSDSTNSTFTLTGGKTYRITCSLAPEHNPANGNNSFGYELVSISGDNIGGVYGRTTSGGSTSPSSSGILDLIYSPTNDIECYIRSSEFYGSTTGATLRAGLGTLVIQEL